MLRMTALAAILATLTASACGDDGDEATVEDASASAPAATSFPPAKGKTLEALIAEAQPTNEIVVSPAGKVLEPGRNRFGFGVFTVAREQVTDARVAIYAAPGPKGKAVGPFPARIESLETKPAFQARTTADDVDSARVVYVSDLELAGSGEWRLVAILDTDEGMLAARMPSAIVEDYPKVPDVGEKAPVVHTPTVDEVGDVGEIDTRNPHGTMHEVDAAETIGSRPTVLLFATPALCASRVCGPVVDVAEEVKAELGDEAAFIHMEVYKENNPNEGIRPQLEAYGLETEPWLFVIDADGRVSARIEGAFSARELREEVERASR